MKPQNKSLLKGRKQFDWLNEISYNALQQSLRNLDTAYQNFFKQGRGFPNFKKRGIRDAFRIQNGNISSASPFGSLRLLDSNHLQLPLIGSVKLRGSLERLNGRLIRQACGVCRS